MVLPAVFHRLGPSAPLLLAGLAALFVGPRIFWSAYCGRESGPEAAFWGGVLSFAVGWTLIGAALGGRIAARRGGRLHGHRVQPGDSGSALGGGVGVRLAGLPRVALAGGERPRTLRRLLPFGLGLPPRSERFLAENRIATPSVRCSGPRTYRASDRSEGRTGTPDVPVATAGGEPRHRAPLRPDAPRRNGSARPVAPTRGRSSRCRRARSPRRSPHRSSTTDTAPPRRNTPR